MGGEAVGQITRRQLDAFTDASQSCIDDITSFIERLKNTLRDSGHAIGGWRDDFNHPPFDVSARRGCGTKVALQTWEMFNTSPWERTWPMALEFVESEWVGEKPAEAQTIKAFGLEFITAHEAAFRIAVFLPAGASNGWWQGFNTIQRRSRLKKRLRPRTPTVR